MYDVQLTQEKGEIFWEGKYMAYSYLFLLIE